MCSNNLFTTAYLRYYKNSWNLQKNKQTKICLTSLWIFLTNKCPISPKKKEFRNLANQIILTLIILLKCNFERNIIYNLQNALVIFRRKLICYLLLWPTLFWFYFKICLDVLRSVWLSKFSSPHNPRNETLIRYSPSGQENLEALYIQAIVPELYRELCIIIGSYKEWHKTD